MTSESGLHITSSYLLDALNFFNILTGDPFYTQRHEDAWALWRERLGEEPLGHVSAAAQAYGKTMIGPQLALVISAMPDFDTLSLSEALSDTNRIEEHFRDSRHYAEDWQKSAALCHALFPVAHALEERGFQEYWLTERLPAIEASIERMHSLDHGVDLEELTAAMLGDAGDSGDIFLYMCSFASPHGIRISGRAYISDMSFSPESTLRIAIHEMFHPPYRRSDIEQEAAALQSDPLFVESFEGQNPNAGYSTEDKFLEENVVEAMEVWVSSRAGLLPDPLKYLQEHDEGSHRLSVILARAFDTVPRRRGETFTTYFRRLVKELPVGKLREEYERIVESRAI